MTKPAQFCWYELMSSDARAAQSFYTYVVGWTAKPAEGAPPGVEYTLLHAADQPVAGMMTLDAAARGAGAKPGWLGYMLVDDVDAAAAKAKSLGGTVHKEPSDIPDINRFAIISDPHGAVIGVMKWAQPMPTPATMPMKNGHTGWHELMAGDLEADFAFYAEMFGWTKAEELDMGPMGAYRLFATGGDAIGGMMKKPAEIPATYWAYYFVVDKIDPAVERVKEKGGQVLNGPMEVPGGAWIINGLDPQGAAFSLVGMK